MMRINVWVFAASIVLALIVGAVGTTVFVKPDTTMTNASIVSQDCKPASKETFRRGGEIKDTGKGKEY